jgi:hypothetical protein
MLIVARRLWLLPSSTVAPEEIKQSIGVPWMIANKTKSSTRRQSLQSTAIKK